MPANPKQVRDLFLAAAEVKPVEREAYLAQQCGTNAELRAEVDRLLAAHEQPASILRQQTVDYAPIAERPGSLIGPYRLMEQIGEGGFGLVFVAEQVEPVKRKVALKIIKPGMDSKQVVARFEAERQALALMDHPNIAKVLDAGATDSGRPYFVMELVRGIPITDYCDQNQLAPKERLELFITVCQAIQHAHQKGIIHRDIKPSNVLVTSHDGKPLAKVIDFGVAKAISQQLTERTIYTNFAQMIGTPLYMSPEQAEMSGLDIDTRSDIYSLGVLLYELLTGTTPLEKKRFAKAAYDEIRRLIREEEPPKPSSRLSQSTATLPSIAAQRHTEPAKLSKLVRGDLDWITMKALEKDRTRRYETANGLARDIQRYLSDEAVEACPPSATYRLRKFAKKNRGALATAGTIAALLVVGILVSGWLAIRAMHAERAAETARADEAQQRQLAEDNEKRALEAAEAEKRAKHEAQAREAETKAVLDFVENKVFAAARPKDQEGGLGHDVTLRKAIEAALPVIDNSFAQQPLIESKLRFSLGTSFQYLGLPNAAIEQFQRAVALCTQHLGADRLETLECMMRLANTYDDAGRYADALKLREETLARQKAVLGADHADTLTSMNNLANSYRSMGRLADSLKLREETLARQRVVLGVEHRETLRCMYNLASLYCTLGRYDEALNLFKQTVPLYSAKLGSDHPETLMSMMGLANSYYFSGRLQEALQLREETLALQKAKLGVDHPHTLLSMNNLATSYTTAGRHADANRLYEEAFALQNAKLGPDHPDTIITRHNLAESYATLGRPAEGLKLAEETLALSRARFGPDHPTTIVSMSYMAYLLDQSGRYAEAAKLHQETLSLRRSKLGPEHPSTLLSMSHLANTYAHLGQHAEALKLQQEVLALRKSKLGLDHPSTLVTMQNVAHCLAHVGRDTEALKMYEDTLALRSAKLGPDHPVTLDSVNALAYFLVTAADAELRKPARAVKLATQAVAGAPKNADFCETLGAAYYRSGDWQRAVKELEHAIGLHKPNDAGQAFCGFFLAMSHWQLGAQDKARDAYRQAVAWMDKNSRTHPDLQRARAEAAALLGVHVTPPEGDAPKPADKAGEAAKRKKVLDALRAAKSALCGDTRRPIGYADGR